MITCLQSGYRPVTSALTWSTDCPWVTVAYRWWLWLMAR